MSLTSGCVIQTTLYRYLQTPTEDLYTAPLDLIKLDYATRWWPFSGPAESSTELRQRTGFSSKRPELLCYIDHPKVNGRHPPYIDFEESALLL